MKAKYRLIDHTADLGIEVDGANIENLFESAAMSMFDLIWDVETTGVKIEKMILVDGDDWSDLMINWLRELLYLWSGGNLLMEELEIISFNEYSILSRAQMIRFDPKHHRIKKDIKAVTYHGLEVKQTDAGWTVTVIFDV
jgi:SHS2 domain-containing protein